MKTLEERTFDQSKLREHWRNIWCILRSIDRHEVKFSDPALQQEWEAYHWPRFRDNPHGHFIKCDSRVSDAIWEIVLERMK